MSRLDKHKAAHKAAVSRKKVQSNPLGEIMRPPLCEVCGLDNCDASLHDGSVMAPSPVGASRPIQVLLADYIGLCQKHGHESPEAKAFLEEHSDDAELLSLCRTSNWLWEKIKSQKRSGQSPAMRDERMRRKGRFPDGTVITTRPFADAGKDTWVVDAWVPVSKEDLKPFTTIGPGIHGCIESLWDQYCRWRDEQKEAAK